MHTPTSPSVSEVLLIEPVWNRNIYRYEDFDTIKGLLIEPVWNRNFPLLRGNRFRDNLLIEPVWNRNMHMDCGVFAVRCSFNRTSMESKLLYLVYRYCMPIELLIEPVWNRN